MDVFRSLEDFSPPARPVFLGLGMFDGVHLGHREIIRQAARAAEESGGSSSLLTFDPHPLRVIAPPPEPILLTTVEERLDLFRSLGVDTTVVLRFDEKLRKMPAEEWVERLAEHVAPARIYVSFDHTFGRDRRGTVRLLQEEGARRGFDVTVVSPVHVGGTLVSSTLVRRLLREGGVEEAARFLGRWYTVRGRVIEGQRRGRALGFPTANLEVHPDKVLPGRGIYAGWARTEENTWQAAMNVGTRPQFGPGPLLVEAHLLDFDGDLYGRSLEVAFARRLRDEVTFATVPDLVRQMEADVVEARSVLTRLQPDEFGPTARAFGQA